MTQLDALRIKVDADRTEDPKLSLLLHDARQFILGYTNRREEQWLSFFDSIQLKIAVIEYNRQGVEGAASRTEGEISTNFLGQADYPDGIMQPLRSRRLVKGITGGR